ncbi:cysteine desulfurase family protein [Candidatus Aenigmatarchaeota archaeon]
MKKTIYLDNAATTPVRKEVKKEMDKYFSKEFGNPGSFNTLGLNASQSLSKARKKIAKIINAEPSEIIFTGSGTESINLAIKGICRKKGKHIITSSVEHHAVLHTCKALEKEGFDVTYLDVDKYGLVDPKEIEKNIRKDTILVSIIYANNEIGTIQPIHEISKITKKHGILFHTDACQAASLNVDVKKLGVDLLSFNGSKIYAPKGVGMLFVKKRTQIKPIIHGGSQEFGLRAGTENVPYIVGFAKALELAQKEKYKENRRLEKLRNKLIKGILKTIPKTFLNGHPVKRLPNSANITFLDIEGEALILYLNEHGIQVSTGSACTSHKLAPSHVILATGLPYEAAHGSVRFSLGKDTTEKDVDYVLKVLPGLVKKIRKISPVHLEEKEVLKR